MSRTYAVREPAPERTRPARVVQTKLEVGARGDVWEQQAERVADRVMRMPAAGKAGCACGGAGCAGGGDDAQTIRRAPLEISSLNESIIARAEEGTLAIRDSAFVEDEEERPAAVQRAAADGAAAGVEPRVEAAIAAAEGGGAPLPDRTRTDMERRFGHDFSRVRVHADDALAPAVHARAFTVGRDVFFAPGRYAPNSDEGRRLIAHELTHVLQQRTAAQRVQRTDAETKARCPIYSKWNSGADIGTYNCAGLAFRTYNDRGDYAAEEKAVRKGTVAPCSAGQVMHWYWLYDMSEVLPDGSHGASHRDFHTVAGVMRPDHSEPDDVYSKNGHRPVHGPATGPSWKPPAAAPYLSNDGAEKPVQRPDGTPVRISRENFTELVGCFSCPP